MAVLSKLFILGVMKQKAVSLQTRRRLTSTPGMSGLSCWERSQCSLLESCIGVMTPGVEYQASPKTNVPWLRKIFYRLSED